MNEMKNSGEKWIGDIPVDWNIQRLRFLCSITTGNMDTQDNNPDGEYPFYVRSPIIEHSDNYTFDNEAVLMAGDGVGAGKVFHYVSGKYGCHQRVYSMSKFTNVTGKFLFYYLTENFYKKIEESNAKSTVDSVRLPMLKDFTVVFPDLDTQLRITTFLDLKCTQIDNIISKQEQIIEKLKEYKLSVITEAVTKGLDPDVEMKDSGIDLCNSIPKHWKTMQNRYLFSLRDDKNYRPLEDVRLLSLYTDLGVFPHGEQEERGNKAVKAEGYKNVYEDDIVVNIILAWMGAIGRSAYDGVTSPAYDIYKPNESACSRYYHYLFRTKAFSNECYKYGRGIMAMRWRTYSSEFKSIRVPVPPYTEQVEIADYLDKKSELIDKTIGDRMAAIEKLQSYKKSLIYEVVTGKKEV